MKLRVGSTTPSRMPSRASIDSMTLAAPMAWPSCDLFALTGGTLSPKTSCSASSSILSPTWVDEACAFTAAMASAAMPAAAMASAMQAAMVGRWGATGWCASEVRDQPASSKAACRPWARANSALAMITQPAPSEMTKPRRSSENGRLALPGWRVSSSVLGLKAPFMVEKPATTART